MIYATGFATFLAVFLITAIGISFVASGPLVLGTELNPNGTTEYMCLGRGCEELTTMGW